jgi:putative methionine-R-sulfoxide reductase with GAF domain
MSRAEARQRLSLGDFLRTRRSDLVAQWTGHVRSLSPMRELSDAAIVDHLPQILERVADIVDAPNTGRRVSLEDLPNVHAVDRLGRGFDLEQIVTEFSVLRRVILTMWAHDVDTAIDVEELRHLDDAFDESICRSAARYASGREKLLKALDRVSEAALGSTDLTVFLHQLVDVMLEGSESVDLGAIFLREGDRLRLRAAVGLEDDLQTGFTLRIGEGLAGHVAAQGRAEVLRDAAADPRTSSAAIRQKGVRALYAVPMMRDKKVIGVAYIGSVTAFEFSEEDKLLFRTMVSRATSGVVKAQILADLQRAETAQRFLADASKELSESLDYERTLGKIARLAVPAVADWCVVDLVQDGAIRRVSIAHADSGKERLTVDLGRQYPAELNGAGGVPRVLRAGVTEWQAECTDDDLGTAARDDHHRSMLQELGAHSTHRDHSVHAIVITHSTAS